MGKQVRLAPEKGGNAWIDLLGTLIKLLPYTLNYAATIYSLDHYIDQISDLLDSNKPTEKLKSELSSLLLLNLGAKKFTSIFMEEAKGKSSDEQIRIYATCIQGFENEIHSKTESLLKCKPSENRKDKIRAILSLPTKKE